MNAAVDLGNCDKCGMSLWRQSPSGMHWVLCRNVERTVFTGLLSETIVSNSDVQHQWCGPCGETAGAEKMTALGLKPRSYEHPHPVSACDKCRGALVMARNDHVNWTLELCRPCDDGSMETLQAEWHAAVCAACDAPISAPFDPSATNPAASS